MPFKSKAQQRYMFAAEERGDIPKGTAKRWAKHTPNIKELPERKKKASVFVGAVLNKMAKDTKDSKGPEDKPFTKALQPTVEAGKGAAKGLLVSLPLAVMGGATVLPLNTQAEAEAFQSAEESVDFAKKLLKQTKVPGAENIPVESDVYLHRSGPHYMPEAGPFRKKMLEKGREGIPPGFKEDPYFQGKEYIHVGGTDVITGRSPFVIAHEVGHATPSNVFAKMLRRARLSPLLGIAPLGLLVGGGLRTSKEDEDISAMAKAAPVVSGARALAVQGEELRATLKGLQLLKETQKVPKNIGRLIMLQQGNYLLHNLAAMAPIVGGAIALKKWHEAQRKNYLKGTGALNKTSALVGTALYASNGPRILDSLLGPAFLRYKVAEMSNSNNPLTAQHKQDMHEQQLQFAQERHEMEMAKAQQDIENRQRMAEIKQLQMVQQQQQTAQPMMPMQNPQAEQQSAQYRQNLLLSQGQGQGQPQQ